MPDFLLEDTADRVELCCPTPAIAMVELVGEHDLGRYEPIGEALHLAAARRRNVLVNLTRCVFIDSTVVGLLLAVRDETTSDGGRFALVVPEAGPVARVAEVMGLSEMFTIYPSLEDALAGSEHVTQIRDLRVRFGDDERYAAECSCGWSGEQRIGARALRTSRADARTHADTRIARQKQGPPSER
jgi:anti-anti-sigma factor